MGQAVNHVEYINEYYHVDSQITQFEYYVLKKDGQIYYPHSELESYRASNKFYRTNTQKYMNGGYPTYQDIHGQRTIQPEELKEQNKQYQQNSVLRELPFMNGSVVRVGILPNQLRGRMYFSQTIAKEDIADLYKVSIMIYQKDENDYSMSYQIHHDGEITQNLIKQVKEISVEVHENLSLLEMTLILEGYNKKEPIKRTTMEQISSMLVAHDSLSEQEREFHYVPDFIGLAQMLTEEYHDNPNPYITEEYLCRLTDIIITIMYEQLRLPQDYQEDQQHELQNIVDEVEKRIQECVCEINALHTLNEVEEAEEEVGEAPAPTKPTKPNKRLGAYEQLKKDKQTVENYLREAEQEKKYETKKALERLITHTELEEEKDYYRALMQHLQGV